jgi:phenol hydroxylase P4 protein
MSVVALHEYKGEVRDSVDHFHGNQLVYVNWEKHLSFCAPLAFPLPPAMPFGALISEVIGQFYGLHPDWAKIDWSKASWMLDGKNVTLDPKKSLAENGIGHKSVLRLTTPGLSGPGGSCA